MAGWLGQAYEEINKAVGMKNRLTESGGKKRIVFPFRMQEFWKCISYVL